LELLGYLYPLHCPFGVAGVQRKLMHTKEDIKATIVIIDHIHRFSTYFKSVSARLRLERVMGT